MPMYNLMHNLHNDPHHDCYGINLHHNHLTPYTISMNNQDLMGRQNCYRPWNSHHDFLTPQTIPNNNQDLMRIANCYRPLKVLPLFNKSPVKYEDGQFHVNLDVQQFLPEEITVKTVDNCIIVEAKHNEKEDEHGCISRNFVRRYVLPEHNDIKKVTSYLSSDGILTIVAPKIKPEDSVKEIRIKITGPYKNIHQDGKQ